MIISADIDTNDLPAMLRYLRKAAGLTLAEVAAEVGISVSYLSDLERGYRGSTLTDKVAAVLTFYGYRARIRVVRNGA